MRFVFGQVDSSGDPHIGQEFTSKRVKQGKFEVTYKQAFPSEPVVVATQVSRRSGRHVCSIGSADARGFTVYNVDGKDGDPRSRWFNFIAIGPS